MELVLIMMVLRVILKGILKAYFRLISSPMKSQSNFGKLAMKYKIGLRLFLFFLFIWDTEYLVYCPLCVLQGLREEKNK